MATSSTRRGFLRRTLGSTWISASLLEQALFRATQARAQSRGAHPKLFDIQKIADGVYLAVAKPVTILNCNAVIFEQANDLLIVDTHSKPSAANALAAQIRSEITQKPIRYIVNSHFHWDHSQGGSAYAKLPKRPDFIASAATRQLLKQNAGARLQESRESALKAVDNYQQKLGAAKTPEEKAFWQARASEAQAYVAEIRDYVPELPNLTLDRDLVIYDKAHEIHVAFRGRGHTAGDVVVYCPQKRVMAVGDLCHPFGPYIGDGYPRDWPKTLREYERFDVNAVAGGHGPLQPSKKMLGDMASYIEELTEAVAKGRRQGQTATQVQASLTPDKFKTLNGGLGREIGETLLRYTINPPGSQASALLAGAVKSNIQHTFQTLDKA